MRVIQNFSIHHTAGPPVLSAYRDRGQTAL